jgi:hypothetical protein
MSRRHGRTVARSWTAGEIPARGGSSRYPINRSSGARRGVPASSLTNKKLSPLKELALGLLTCPVGVPFPQPGGTFTVKPSLVTALVVGLTLQNVETPVLLPESQNGLVGLNEIPRD